MTPPKPALDAPPPGWAIAENSRLVSLKDKT